MIGNDIVDLAEAEASSNWKRPRFLEKLFTVKEQQFIHNSENPFIMVWRFWSMKEAAYKLFTQLYPSRFYKPNQFECDINAPNENVRYKDFECYVNTKITAQYILSEARLDKSEMNSKCVILKQRLPRIQSETTKDELLGLISRQFNILKHELKIIKSEFGIPLVYQKSKKLNIGISISHHGNFGAYAIS